MRISGLSARAALWLAMISILVCGSLLQQQGIAYAHHQNKIASKESATNFDRARDEIAKILAVQAKAWNEGDLAGFMSVYSKRNDTSYVSRDTQVYGYDAIETRYKKRYGDNRDSMGSLTFSDLKYVDVSPTSVICIGHWLVEKKGERLSGIFSLIFIKEESGWKILHDHTS